MVINIMNAKIIFKNFSGDPRKNKYAKAGERVPRTFCVLIDQELANNLASHGAAVKTLQSNGDEPPQFFIKVNVNMESANPPEIWVVTEELHRKTLLDGDRVNQLDGISIKYADISVNTYEYIPGKMSFYLRTMYAERHMNDLDLKYADYLVDDGSTVYNAI